MSPPASEAAASRGGLRKLFWVAVFGVALLAVAALGTTGYLAQQELRNRLEALETELDRAERKLAATNARARAVQTTLDRVHQLSGQLAASLEELHALTAPSLAPSAAPAPTGRSGSRKSGRDDQTPAAGPTAGRGNRPEPSAGPRGGPAAEATQATGVHTAPAKGEAAVASAPVSPDAAGVEPSAGPAKSAPAEIASEPDLPAASARGD